MIEKEYYKESDNRWPVSSSSTTLQSALVNMHDLNGHFWCKDLESKQESREYSFVWLRLNIFTTLNDAYLDSVEIYFIWFI